MTEQVWFTSDQHYGHRAILTLGRGRPFASVEEMDEAMIERHNAMVKPNDRVYYLGDFCFSGANRFNEIMSRLQGKKHFIRGNHDSVVTPGREWWFESVSDYKEIKVEGCRIVMLHYPMISWHQVARGSFHLHGHTHSNLRDNPTMRRLDIGVDGHSFYPWSWEEIYEKLKDRNGTPPDHHQ